MVEICSIDKSRPGCARPFLLARASSAGPGAAPASPLTDLSAHAKILASVHTSEPSPGPLPPLRSGTGTSQGRTLELLRNPAGEGGLRRPLRGASKSSMKGRNPRLARLPRGRCWMVRVGENGQSVPLPGRPSFELCPCMPDGAERSLMGPSNSAQTARRFRDALPPPPPSCFSVGGPLAWVPVLAA